MAVANTIHSAASIAALFFAGILFACSRPAGAEAPELDRQPVPDMEAGWHQGMVPHDGLARTFRFYVPDKLAAEVPVVVLLHGGTGNAAELFDRKGRGTREWLEIAEQEGLLLLVPNGTDPQTGAPTGDKLNWNDCRPKTGRRFSEADDTGFIDALLDQIAERFARQGIVIDTDRVYVTGSSNGGLMAYRLATELPDRFAAAAVFIANRPAESECSEAASPMPMLIVNGTADPLMPFAGGTIGKRRGVVLSAEDTRAYWIRVNHARPAGLVVHLPDRDPDDGSEVSCEMYPPASRKGAPVRFCEVAGGGHSMPSIEHVLSRFAERFVGRQNHDIEGAQVAWEFLKSFTAQQVERGAHQPAQLDATD